MGFIKSRLNKDNFWNLMFLVATASGIMLSEWLMAMPEVSLIGLLTLITSLTFVPWLMISLNSVSWVGGKAFVSKPAHLQNLQGVIIMDMVGYACYTTGCQKYPAGLPVTPLSDKGDFLAVVGDLENLPLLNTFANSSENLPKILKIPIPLKGLLTPDTLRSDHAPFWYQGVGAVLVTDTANLRSPHYHQPSDVPKNIQRAFFTGAAQIIINATSKLLK